MSQYNVCRDSKVVSEKHAHIKIHENGMYLWDVVSDNAKYACKKLMEYYPTRDIHYVYISQTKYSTMTHVEHMDQPKPEFTTW
jgi:hypothetical protein